MTHPDILRMEYEGPPDEPDREELCAYCGEEIRINESDEALQSEDGFFCSRGCCDEYYGIQEL